MALTASVPRCGRGPSRAPCRPSVKPFLPGYRALDIEQLCFMSYNGHACVFARASSKRQTCAQWVTEEQWRVRAWPATASERPAIAAVTHCFEAMLQYVRQELTKAGLGDEHADAFLTKLRRSFLARPDAGLADFHEFCCRLEVNEEEVCGQAP